MYQGCGNRKKIPLVQGHVNGHDVLVQRKFYLSDSTDFLTLSNNSLKPDINSLVNSVDPDQMASEESS